MIHQTTKKEIRRIRSLRKTRPSKGEGLYFIGVDGKPYFCDKSGMEGTREMTEWNKTLKAQLTAQQTLL